MESQDLNVLVPPRGRLKLTQTIEESIEEHKLLALTKERLEASESLETVQQIVRRSARQIAGADGATFVLRDVDHCYYADEDAISPLWKGQRFPITNCISGWAMLNAQSVVVPDISNDERIPLAAYRPTFVKSLAMVPVGKPEPVAAIGAYWATLHSASEDVIDSLEALAEATHSAMERIGLFGAPTLPAVHVHLDTETLSPVDENSADPELKIDLRDDHERIARDLHDTVLQELFASAMILQSALGSLGRPQESSCDSSRDHRLVDEGGVADRIDTALVSIDRSIRGLRGVIFGLEYGHARLNGIAGDVLAIAADASRALGFKPDVRFNGALESIGDDLAHTIKAVLAELLSNVARHANASTVAVELSAGPVIDLEVVDDGVGADGNRALGNGLTNLRSRAECYGGTFEVSAATGGGTSARWCVPLPLAREVAVDE